MSWLRKSMSREKIYRERRIYRGATPLEPRPHPSSPFQESIQHQFLGHPTNSLNPSMAPSKNSPLPNPFFTSTANYASTSKSPRSSLSGKDSLGRIPSISSLKSTVDRMGSPARRVSSSMAASSTGVASGPVSENERPRAAFHQLGKHFHSYDDLGAYEAGAPSVKRRSPRKQPKTNGNPEQQSAAEDLDALLAVQKTLFRLRTRIADLTEVGDYFSATHWLRDILNDPAMSPHAHWSDFFRLFKLAMLQQVPAKIILESMKGFSPPMTGHLSLLKVELLASEGAWEEPLMD